MSRYRRAGSIGASYFFTVVSFRRQPILCDEPVRLALRQAIQQVRLHRPFEIDAWVLLPDHLHCIWTLPADDGDFSSRWMIIKRQVSLACRDLYLRTDWLSPSRQKHRDSTIWQRRFWEHRIRDDADMERHCDCIHFNPVKHGHAACVGDWPHSTFHRFVRDEIYPTDWTLSDESVISGEV